MSNHELAASCVAKLCNIYAKSEAEAITKILLENYTNTQLSTTALELQLSELMAYRPIQYVIAQAWFYNDVYKVNEHVLIPRPETEELVWHVLTYCQSKNITNSILLDIGTGSGCIPISIKRKIPTMQCYGVDVSSAALEVAMHNSNILQAPVTYALCNVLDSIQWNMLPKVVDVIISNPPYITPSETELMEQNVLEYEPHLALFVPENDPLLFYKKITTLAIQYKKRPMIFFEINPLYALEIKALLTPYYPKVEIIQDVTGKQRFVHACM